VQEDQKDEEGCSGDGRQAGGPVGDAELAEEAFRTPIVEGGFFKPGLAVEDGGDGTGEETVFRGFEVLAGEAAGEDVRMFGIADLIVLGEHLAGDLGVAGFVGSDEAELVATETRGEAVEQEEESYGEEDDVLPRGREGVRADDIIEDSPEKRRVRVADDLRDGRGLDRFGHRVWVADSG
jgi:hypothetical protein